MVKYKTLYHGTSVKAWRSIKIEGLSPKYNSRWGKTKEERDDEPSRFIFFSRSPLGALSWGKVVLELKLPPYLVKRLIFNLGEFIRCPVKIPIKYIKKIT